ncbi:MAG: AAA family ATPase [Selenomonadaceae bacterium]|nr:AAA family ATPase [Selenomonadaceae bacterium]
MMEAGETAAVLATITTLFRRQGDGRNNSSGRPTKEQREAHGRVTPFVVIAGDEALLNQEIAIKFAFDGGSLERRLRPLRKGCVVQLVGRVEPLTKTKNIFVADKMIVASPSQLAGVAKSKLGFDPQDKRNSIIKDNLGFALWDVPIVGAEVLETQEVQSIAQWLADIGYSFDIDTAYAIAEFFHRRAKSRGFGDVYEMIKKNPMVLAEISYKVPELSYDKLYQQYELFNRDTGLEKISLKNSDKAKAAVASTLQRLTQRGHVCSPIATVAIQAQKALREVTGSGDARKWIEYIIGECAVNEGRETGDGFAYRGGFAHIVASGNESRRIGGGYDKEGMLAFYSQVNLRQGKKPVSAGFAHTLYLQQAFFSELRGAERLMERIREKPWTECLVELDSIADLDDTQKKALRMALQHNVSVIVGGAGTGKTKTISKLVTLLQKHGFRSVILAPSAKAAVNAAKQTEREGGGRIDYQTIHRFARLLPEDEDMGEGTAEKAKSEEELRELRCIIVDEMSMTTMTVFYRLLCAVAAHPRIKLVLVGDNKQLPAIGPRFFDQLVSPGLTEHIIPVTRFQRNYRAESNRFAAFCNEFRQGNFVLPDDGSVEIYEGAWENFLQEHKETAKDPNTMFLVQTTEEEKQLNACLRRLRGNDLPEYQIGDTMLYLHDPVITTQNDYTPEPGEKANATRYPERNINVYNGTEGVIEECGDNGVVTVRMFSPEFEEEKGVLVKYRLPELTTYLKPAYAITVHKAQGCQADTVVFVATGRQSTQNLVYTAITRAKKKLYIIGSARDVAEAATRPESIGIAKFAFRLRKLYQDGQKLAAGDEAEEEIY